MSKDRILIYRMVHYQNIEGLLTYGIHCANSETKIQGYINLGDTKLITKRNTWDVKAEPFGVLADYVPFYLCER